MMTFKEFSSGTKIRQLNINEILEDPEIGDRLKLRLLAELQKLDLPPDSFFYHCSEPHDWDAGMGSEGYIAVRAGEIVAEVVHRMN